MTRGFAALCAAALAVAGSAAAPAAPAAPVRVEAHSEHYRLVALVRDGAMQLHISRRLDNAPVTDAVVAVTLRGKTHAATADADGGYSVDSPDLRLPGSAAVVFKIAADGVDESLDGTIQGPVAPQKSTSSGSARQLGWWVLNFAVCIGFLALIARRNKRNPS